MSRAGCYEIRVEETLEPRWAQWFAEMEIQTPEDGSGTLLRGRLPDQAALYGLIGRLRNLNLTLVEVRRIDAGEK